MRAFKMKDRFPGKILSFLLFCLILIAASSSRAGEVITEDTRSWARKVLEEEKTLKGVEGRNTLAVLYFRNKTGQAGLDPIQKGLALMLITDLSKVEGIQVVERVKLQALVEELGLGTSGLVESDTAPRVGKLLGAQWLAGGDITEGQPSVLQLQSRLLDAPTADILGSPMSEGRLTDLFRMEKEILFDIIKLLKIEVTPQQEARLKKPCSTSNAALMALFQGIDASDRGNYREAAEQYKKALKRDRGICISRDALTELRRLDLAASRSKEMVQSASENVSQTNTITRKDPDYRKPEPKDVKTPLSIELKFP